MHIRVGDKIKTGFCTARVESIIEGSTRGWDDTLYYEVTVTSPRLYWKRRRQIIKVTEVRAKI